MNRALIVGGSEKIVQEMIRWGEVHGLVIRMAPVVGVQYVGFNGQKYAKIHGGWRRHVEKNGGQPSDEWVPLGVNEHNELMRHLGDR